MINFDNATALLKEKDLLWPNLFGFIKISTSSSTSSTSMSENYIVEEISESESDQISYIPSTSSESSSDDDI